MLYVLPFFGLGVKTYAVTPQKGSLKGIFLTLRFVPPYGGEMEDYYEKKEKNGRYHS